MIQHPNYDFDVRRTDLYAPYMGKKRRSKGSMHMLPRLRRTRLIFCQARSVLKLKWPAIQRTRLKAGAYLMDEPFQISATSIGKPVTIFVAPCVEELHITAILGVIAFELACALVEHHAFVAPDSRWAPLRTERYFIDIAEQAFEVPMRINANGLPEMTGVLPCERGRNRRPWMAPWTSEDVDSVEDLEDLEDRERPYGPPVQLELTV